MLVKTFGRTYPYTHQDCDETLSNRLWASQICIETPSFEGTKQNGLVWHGLAIWSFRSFAARHVQMDVTSAHFGIQWMSLTIMLETIEVVNWWENFLFTLQLCNSYLDLLFMIWDTPNPTLLSENVRQVLGWNSAILPWQGVMRCHRCFDQPNPRCWRPLRQVVAKYGPSNMADWERMECAHRELLEVSMLKVFEGEDKWRTFAH